MGQTAAGDNYMTHIPALLLLQMPLPKQICDSTSNTPNNSKPPIICNCLLQNYKFLMIDKLQFHIWHNWSRNSVQSTTEQNYLMKNYFHNTLLVLISAAFTDNCLYKYYWWLNTFQFLKRVHLIFCQVKIEGLVPSPKGFAISPCWNFRYYVKTSDGTSCLCKDLWGLTPLVDMNQAI